MKSIKCPSCGLVNFETQTSCKRCKNFLKFAYATSQPISTPNEIDKISIENDEGSELWFIGVGFLFILGGIILLVWNWSSAMNEGKFGGKSFMLAPVAIVVGIKFTIQRSAKDTPFWIFLQILGAIVGLLNFLYFIGFFN